MERFQKLILIITLLAYANGALATDCSAPVISLSEGQSAPCTGYLFSKDEEHKAELTNEGYKLLQEEKLLEDQEVEFLKKQVEDLNEAVTIEQQKSDLWEKKANDYSTKFENSDENRGRRDALFLGLGILLTIGAGFALGAAAKRVP